MKYSKIQVTTLVLMRLAIGWHFLYEGGVKVLSGSWTSKAYLADSGGFMKNFFTWIAGNETALRVTDLSNAWGLTLIGLSLLVGLFTRFSAGAGMLLLLLYYLSHPAIPGISYMFPSDGSYFIINKTLVELFALAVLMAFPTSRQFGLARITRLNNTWTD